MEKPKTYSLAAVIKGLKVHIDEKVKGKVFWVRAAISQVKVDQKSGHCYLTLHETTDDISKAQCRGNIWSFQVEKIRRRIGSDFEGVIKAGNEVVLQIELEFNEMHGLSANVKDVDVSFNLGLLETRKRETIERLTKECLIAKNREHKLPAVIQRIAVIGSPGTDGITDLIKQLTNNQYGYVFAIQVFACPVQGADAERNIVARLEELNGGAFDLVAIVRGGGSKLEMDVFNSYEIAKGIANHRLPVFTGIGHEQDSCVADLVANLNHKTPTALGAYLVERASDFEGKITSAFNDIQERYRSCIKDCRNTLSSHVETLKHKGIYQAQLKKGELNKMLAQIGNEVREKVNTGKTRTERSLQEVREKARLEVSRHQGLVQNAQKDLQALPLKAIANIRQRLSGTLEMLHARAQFTIRESIRAYRNALKEAADSARQQVDRQLHEQEGVQDMLTACHPVNTLSKGYAIPRYKGRLLNGSLLKPGEQLEIELDGRTLTVAYINETQKQELRTWNTQKMKSLITIAHLENLESSLQN